MSEETKDAIHTTEGGGVHHFENASVSVSDGTAWYESKTYKSVLAFIKIGTWLMFAITFIGGLYLYQRDVNAQSTGNVNDIVKEIKGIRDLADERKRQADSNFADIKNTTVTVAVFNAQFDALNKRLDRIEAALDRVR